VKTRILAGGIHSAKQQIGGSIARPAGRSESASRAYTRKIKSALDGCDAVLLSDYGSGLVTPALAELVRRTLAQRSRRRPVPVLVDSRYRLLDYRGFTTCTPNESEVEQVVGIRVNDNALAVEQAGRRLLQRTRMGAVLVTRGAAAWRCSNRGSRPCTCRFWIRRSRRRDGCRRHRHRGRRPRALGRRFVYEATGWPTTPAASSS
jgi:bifunctional ADP-heptose synthase (sugar kinase/adenylyltransferase)